MTSSEAPREQPWEHWLLSSGTLELMHSHTLAHFTGEITEAHKGSGLCLDHILGAQKHLMFRARQRGVLGDQKSVTVGPISQAVDSEIKLTPECIELINNT